MLKTIQIFRYNQQHFNNNTRYVIRPPIIIIVYKQWQLRTLATLFRFHQMDMSKIGTKIPRHDLCGTNWLWKVYSKLLKQNYTLQKQNQYNTTRTFNTTLTNQFIQPPHHEPSEPVTLTQQRQRINNQLESTINHESNNL